MNVVKSSAHTELSGGLNVVDPHNSYSMVFIHEKICQFHGKCFNRLKVFSENIVLCGNFVMHVCFVNIIILIVGMTMEKNSRKSTEVISWIRAFLCIEFVCLCIWSVCLRLQTVYSVYIYVCFVAFHTQNVIQNVTHRTTGAHRMKFNFRCNTCKRWCERRVCTLICSPLIQIRETITMLVCCYDSTINKIT